MAGRARAPLPGGPQTSRRPPWKSGAHRQRSRGLLSGHRKSQVDEIGCVFSLTHMRTMVLEYLPTKLGHFWGKYVGKDASTMVRIWVTT